MLQNLAKSLHLSPIVFYLICFTILLLVACALGYLLKLIFRRWSKNIQNNWGKSVLKLLESLSVPLAVLTAMYTALEVLTLPKTFEQLGSKAIFALVVVAIFFFLTRVAVLFLSRWNQQDPALRRVTEPVGFLVRIVFAFFAAIIIFDNLGIHLTAVWTTLGVGSVAVALALQDTLGNFFAGVYLLVDRPVSPGDYVKLDAGQEGYVASVGWRSTTFRTLGNNSIIIPNSSLAKAVITNYSTPEESMSLDIRVGVAYGTDARRVEKILVEEAEKAMADGVEGLSDHFTPAAQLNPGFGDSSLTFTLGVKVRRFVDQFSVQSELRKRILERFQKEGIEMPFSTRTIIMDKSGLPDRAEEPPSSPGSSPESPQESATSTVTPKSS